MRSLAQPIAMTLISALVACAAPVQVAFDGRQDFARYRTWAWAPGASYYIDASSMDAGVVHARVAGIIESQFRALGLERVPRRRADFFVAYRLVMRQETVKVRKQGAARTLTSFHGVSYTVEPVETEIRTRESSHLVIGLAGPDGQIIWVGELDRRVPRSFKPHFEDSAARILSRFPPPPQPGGRGPAHPPALQEERRMLAAMFLGVGPGGDSNDATEIRR